MVGCVGRSSKRLDSATGEARGEGRIPTVDRDGELVRSLREGRVELHGAAEAWEAAPPAVSISIKGLSVFRAKCGLRAKCGT